MLELRPCCECCGSDLPADSKTAVICSFECTFCQICDQQILKGVCPNCGGELLQRPTREEKWLDKNPPSTNRIVNNSGCGSTSKQSRTPWLQTHQQHGHPSTSISSSNENGHPAKVHTSNNRRSGKNRWYIAPQQAQQVTINGSL